MITRRNLLALAALPAIAQQPTKEWGTPVLDMHLHFRKDDANLAHLEGSGVTVANLLTPSASDSDAQTAIAKHPARYLRFTSADITKPRGIAQMRKCLKDGAKGLGEIKYNVAVDSPEMRAVYELAAEFRAPVTIHFQEDSSGSYSAPLKMLPAMLKAYPKTTFIGHANAFWANISANVPAGASYPQGKIEPGGLTGGDALRLPESLC